MISIAVTGHIGGMVRDYLVNKGVVPIDADITDKDAVKDEIVRINPKVVIHAAALTSVDECESDYKKAFEVNVRGTMNVGEACEAIDARVIYLSTCHVFDGKKPDHLRYTEMSKPNPKNNYGFTKWEGEIVLSSLFVPYVVVRVSKLFSADKVRSYLRSTVVNGVDAPFFMWRNYTYLSDFADKLIAISKIHNDFPKRMTLNLSASTPLTVYDFWIVVLEMAVYGHRDLVKARHKELDSFVFRPHNGLLSGDVAKEYGIEMLSTHQGIREMLKEL